MGGGNVKANDATADVGEEYRKEYQQRPAPWYAALWDTFGKPPAVRRRLVRGPLKYLLTDLTIGTQTTF
jgi:hypothetical protein